jgi:predicted dehydrogenase
MTRPTIGFIGTGMMGQLAHLGNYVQLRDRGECSIAGVTDLKPLLAEAVAEKYQIPHVYANNEALLSDPDVDAVVCVQQWANNYQLVKQVLQAGKSVITEKPMVGRVDEAEELVELARQKGVQYAVGFMKRYDMGVELAKHLVSELQESQELGPLLTIDALCNGGDWLHNVGAHIAVDDPTPLPPLQPTFPDACQTAEQRAAYHYLVNIFSHNVNLCHHFLDAEMIVRAAQFNGDCGMQALLHSGNVIVTVRGTVSPAYEWRERTTLTFAKGEIVVVTPTPMNRQMSARVKLLKQGKQGFTTTEYHAPVGWAFFREAEGFVRALAGQEPLRAPAEKCLWDVRVMERIITIAEGIY